MAHWKKAGSQFDWYILDDFCLRTCIDFKNNISSECSVPLKILPNVCQYFERKLEERNPAPNIDSAIPWTCNLKNQQAWTK